MSYNMIVKKYKVCGLKKKLNQVLRSGLSFLGFIVKYTLLRCYRILSNFLLIYYIKENSEIE